MPDTKEGPGLPRPRKLYSDPSNHPLKEEVAGLPRSPGVYLFKDRQGKVLYVGKAVRLRDRVRSYFSVSHSNSFWAEMVGGLLTLARQLDYVVVTNEREALVLEASLIQLHRPAFNVRFNDDKRYPYLKLTNHRFPRVMLARRIRDDGAQYFGPFTDMKVKSTIKLVRALFGIRDCKKLPDKACLNYHIGMCSAPCVRATDEQDYQASIHLTAEFLKGRNTMARQTMRELMEQAAAQQHFEKAADIRDHLSRLELLQEGQAAVLISTERADVVDLELDQGQVLVLHVRESRLLGQSQFQLMRTRGLEREAVLAQFLVQFYSGNEIPGLILVPFEPKDDATIRQWLDEQHGSRVQLLIPQRGEKRRLQELARENLAELTEHRQPPELYLDVTDRDLAGILKDLQHRLSLPTYPEVIEGFDVSTLQGQFTVGARVTFVGALPDKSRYRRYRMRSLRGQDDYASMKEMLGRRFSRYNETLDPQELPDWLLIDGGKGQLSAAAEALQLLDIPIGKQLQLLSLAKKEELIHIHGHGKPMDLDRRDPGLRLLQRVRDESHRFGLGYHRLLRSKALKGSRLEGIEGIGSTRAAALLQAFGSLEGVRKASLENIASLPGWGPTSARKVKEAFSRR